MANAEVSHGRGGAGNILPDNTPYVDGSVVRAGVEGSHGDGAYSSGRGGAGNIGDVGTPAKERKDHDLVPDAAIRHSHDQPEGHTGRGGAGNIDSSAVEQQDKKPSLEAPMGLADKIKGKLFGKPKK